MTYSSSAITTPSSLATSTTSTSTPVQAPIVDSNVSSILSTEVTTELIGASIKKKIVEKISEDIGSVSKKIENLKNPKKFKKDTQDILDSHKQPRKDPTSSKKMMSLSKLFKITGSDVQALHDVLELFNVTLNSNDTFIDEL